MEGLLRGKELHKIEDLERLKEKAYNLKSSIVFFPVRHHSPICTYHLKRTLDEYKPQAILVEGPKSVNEIIDGLTEEDSKPPLSIYLTHSQGIKEDREKYMCYYPMLKYSPEYFALKYARERGIHASFIDLSFGEIIASSERGKGFRETMKKQEYGDDRYLKRSTYLKEVFKRIGVRDYHEFWEKHFEMRGVHMSSEEFVHEMLTYCYIMRTYHTEDELQEDGCIAREKYMAANIKEASEKFKRILVLTGGFHTFGILKYMEEDKKYEGVKARGESEAYLTPYSYKHSDASSGYKSGMPYPYYYGRIWDGLKSGDEDNCYYETSKYFISKCNRTLRSKGEGTSTDDSINALVMAQGLSDLRDKKFIGSSEIIESVGSCFIKGERNDVNSTPLKTLGEIMVGDLIGEVSSKVETAPIVKDFKDKCRKYRIKLTSMTKEEKILEKYGKKRHKEVSRFFHRVTFLIPEFGSLIKGDTIVNGDGKSLKREIWNYSWSPGLQRTLIEKSVYGGSILEAAEELISSKSSRIQDSSGEFSYLLLNCASMGLHRKLKILSGKMRTMIYKDRNFLSVCECLRNIMHISKMELDKELNLTQMIKAAYQRGILLIDGDSEVSPMDEKSYIDSIMLLNHIASEHRGYEDVLIERFEEIIQKHKINASVEGVILGLLYSWNRIGYRDILKRMKGYLTASGEERRKSASFLKGIFVSSRDIFLKNSEMIGVLDEFINTLDSTDFMEILPEMRYAFTSFMPREIDAIGMKVASIYNSTSEDILLNKGVSELEIEDGKNRDKLAEEILKGWGVLDG